MAAGKNVSDALTTIRETRGLDVRETEEQQRWLRDFSSWLAGAAGATIQLGPARTE